MKSYQITHGHSLKLDKSETFCTISFRKYTWSLIRYVNTRQAIPFVAFGVCYILGYYCQFCMHSVSQILLIGTSKRLQNICKGTVVVISDNSHELSKVQNMGTSTVDLHYLIVC